MAIRSAGPEIHKFGGASLADAAAIRHAVGLVADLPRTPVVVVSALAGVTDSILDAVSRASSGDGRRARVTQRALRERYLSAAARVLGGRRGEITRAIHEAFDELDRLLLSLAPLRHVESRTQDYLLARGERLTALLVAAALREAGRRAQYV